MIWARVRSWIEILETREKGWGTGRTRLMLHGIC